MSNISLTLKKIFSETYSDFVFTVFDVSEIDFKRKFKHRKSVKIFLQSYILHLYVQLSLFALDTFMSGIMPKKCLLLGTYGQHGGKNSPPQSFHTSVKAKQKDEMIY